MCRRSSCSVCGTIGLIVGLLVGIGVGVLFFYELLPGLAAVLPIVLTLGAVALALLLIGLVAARPSSVAAACLADNGNRLLAGALGTVVSVLAALLFSTGTLFILQLVLTAVAAFFTAYLAVQIVCFVTCVTRCLCGVDDRD